MIERTEFKGMTLQHVAQGSRVLANEAAVPQDRFIMWRMPRLARVGRAPVPARAISGANSYQGVCNQLQLINNPMTQAFRNRLVRLGSVVVPVLLRALAHRNKIVRSGAAEVLGRIFHGAGNTRQWKGLVCRFVVMPKLIAALKDRYAVVRRSAAEALQKIGVRNARVHMAVQAVLRGLQSRPPVQFNPFEL